MLGEKVINIRNLIRRYRSSPAARLLKTRRTPAGVYAQDTEYAVLCIFWGSGAPPESGLSSEFSRLRAAGYVLRDTP